MSITDDCGKFVTRTIIPEDEETTEALAERMFVAYTECLSAHAGRDLYPIGGFGSLDEDTRRGWADHANRLIASIEA